MAVEPAPPRALGRWQAAAVELADLAALAAATVRCWFTPPFGWWGEAVAQGWLLVRRTLIPTMLSLFAFGFGAVAVQGGGFVSELGAADRMGALFSVASLREFVPFVTGMVVAGVAGTAICADLGARRVREELDALAVIGVDAVRTLVAPRVLALMVITPALNIVGLVLATLSGLAAVGAFGGTTGGFLASFQAGFTLPDLIANVVKTTVFGFIIGIVCAHKGMNASGGSEGVGRAVNQAVVIAFIAIFVFNYAFNATYQAALPSAQDIR
ncbi:putative ABC-transporter integral membrane protein [Patulibacter medicamentivorans]|uniref:Putative ABC-transporter integral membrane protein n=1 Tax=Patulibacter medicamentivorans TaxID=1097667 RepID=H0E6N1_9ACTN|nr:putative ABC-transporter integral membrane protein [Patulibacter medicamentivorans]